MIYLAGWILLWLMLLLIVIQEFTSCKYIVIQYRISIYITIEIWFVGSKILIKWNVKSNWLVLVMQVISLVPQYYIPLSINCLYQCLFTCCPRVNQTASSPVFDLTIDAAWQVVFVAFNAVFLLSIREWKEFKSDLLSG